MSDEFDPVRAAIAAHLADDEDLSTIATGGVHHGKAPAGTPYPYVVLSLHVPGRVWSMRSYWRNDLWLVKGVCRGRSADEAEAIDSRCEALLNDADLAIDGANLMYLRREGGMPLLADDDSGETIFQMGGLYRLQAEPT